MAGKDGASGGGEHDEDDVQLGEVARLHRGHHERGSGGQRHRGRALRDAQEGGGEVARHDDRDAQARHAVGQGIANAGGAQHLAEHAARAGEQHDRAHRTHRGLQGLFNLLGADAARGAQDDHSRERGDEERDGGLAEEDQEVHPARVPVDRSGLGERGQARIAEDEEQGDEQDADDRASGRRLCRLLLRRGLPADKHIRDLEIGILLAQKQAPAVAGEVPSGQRD